MYYCTLFYHSKVHYPILLSADSEKVVFSKLWF